MLFRSGVAVEAEFTRNVDAAQDKRPSRFDAVIVPALADPHLVGLFAEEKLSQFQVVRLGDLDVAIAAGNDADFDLV